MCDEVEDRRAADRVAERNGRAALVRGIQHGTVPELFRIGMELQAIAGRVSGTPLEQRLEGLVQDLDNVIRDLRRRVSRR